MTPHYSVAVIGAGPTGLMLANLLGKANVNTLLVEANEATVREPRAVSIDDESLRVIQQLDLEDEVKSEIIPGYGSRYLGPDRSMFLQVTPQDEPYGHPRRNAFRQPVFEAQLRHSLLRFGNVEAQFNRRAEFFEQHGSGVRISLRRGAEPSSQVTAEYVVGCDGAQSSIREALGYSLSGSSLQERWLIVDLECCPSASPETRVYCDHRQPGIMLPGPRHTRRYEFKLLPEQVEEDVLSAASVESLLRSHDFVAGSRIVRKTIYHFHARIANKWGRDRVWLAGDAAHLMPPFAGQGMNGGIRDAANLYWKLKVVIEGRAGPKLLDSYEQERRDHVREMIGLALKMGTIFAPRSWLDGLLIRTAFRALGFWPAAKTWFSEMKYKPAPRFGAGFVVERQLTRSGIVGRMLPQPRLNTAGGSIMLDAALGDGFALLGIGIDSSAVNALSLGEDWDALIARRVALPLHEVPMFAACAGMLLLVRPDRYVMARFTLAQAPQIREDLAELLDQTWPASEARGIVNDASGEIRTAKPVLSTGDERDD